MNNEAPDDNKHVLKENGKNQIIKRISISVEFPILSNPAGLLSTSPSLMFCFLHTCTRLYPMRYCQLQPP